MKVYLLWYVDILEGVYATSDVAEAAIEAIIAGGKAGSPEWVRRYRRIEEYEVNEVITPT